MRLYIFFLCHAAFSIVIQGTRPIVSMYSHSLGANEAVIGLLVSVFALMPMLLAIRIGKWLDIFGARRLTVLGGTGMGIAFLIPVVYPTIYSLFVSQLIMGVSHLSILVSLQKTIGNYPGSRDKLIATFSLVGSLGELIGPLFTGFSYDYFGFRYTYSATAIIAILAVFLAFTVKSDQWLPKNEKVNDKTERKESTWKLLKNNNLRKAVVLSGLVLYSKDLFVAYFPIYGSQIGLSASQIGILISIMAAAALIVRVVQFRLVDTFGRGKVILTTLAMSGAAFFLIPFFTHQVVIGMLVILLGAGLGLGQPISLVYALNVSPDGRQGEVLGLRLTFNRGSQFIAPFIFGSLGTFMGISPVFWLSGLVLMIGAKYTQMNTEEDEGSLEGKSVKNQHLQQK